MSYIEEAVTSKIEGAIDNLDMADVGMAFIEGGAIAATGGASLGAKLMKEAVIAGTSTAIKSIIGMVNIQGHLIQRLVNR